MITVIAVTADGSTPCASRENVRRGGPVPSAAGARALAGSFTIVPGQTGSISSPQGRPTLVWLVATWCPSCQAGTQAVASQLISRSARRHVRVVKLEDYAVLGPARPAFARQYGSAGFRSWD